MHKPTAQAMHTATFLIEHDYVKRMKPLHLAALLDTKTRLPALIKALRALVKAWESIPETEQVPEQMNTVKLWGAARAALQDAEGSSDAETA